MFSNGAPGLRTITDVGLERIKLSQLPLYAYKPSPHYFAFCHSHLVPQIDLALNDEFKEEKINICIYFF